MAYQFTLDQTQPTEHILKTFGQLPSMPTYNFEDKVVGDWTVKTFKCGVSAGYWSTASDVCTENGGQNIALLRHNETVMSITPMELESHLIPYNEAQGNVVIAGLGLAMITINLLKKRSVKKLTVLEIDDSVISLYPNILTGRDKQLWIDNIESGRLQIIKQDCTAIIPKDVIKKIGKVDYMWVDTWDYVGSYDSLPITQNLQKQLKAKQCDFWTMEFVWFSEICAIPEFRSSPLKVFRKWLEQTGLPLTATKVSTNKQRLLLDLSLITAALQVRMKQQNELKKANYER